MTFESRSTRVRVHATLSLACVIGLLLPQSLGTTHAQTPLPAGFTDAIVLGGLDTPTAVAFAPDGRVFVAEKSGIVKVFDSLSDTTASVFADLRTQVHNYADRGLLGLAVDPQFPSRPYVYVLYTRDADIGGVAPKWGTPGATTDSCPDPPGMTHGCTASGRLSRLEAAGNTWTGTEHVLVDDWFQQFDSHSMGALAFGDDGALYASGGEAASWQFVDYGQRGIPLNPNGDPPVPPGGTQTPPTAEGGALRAQDLRTEGDPVGLSGSVIRIDPDTGAALPDNPLFSHDDPNARRIVAYGMRNPFRIATRPGTPDIWVGDVGWRWFEEINIIPNPAASGRALNFGWPCYDGIYRQEGYDAANLNICEDLYAESGAVTFAHFQYRENIPVVANDPCRNTDQSLSGLAFYEGGSYPDEYDGALFFADYTRQCIWVMRAGTNGVPDPSRVSAFIHNAAFPVDLKVGPGGDLFYVDIVAGTIHRIRYTTGNRAPVAVASASPRSGQPPLAVSFSSQGSSDPDGSALTYSWDLNGDGAYGDSSAPNPSYTYTSRGSYTVRLRVTDDQGLQGTTALSIVVGNSAPTAIIENPSTTLRWVTGGTYAFSGYATDPEDGLLPVAALTWTLVLSHCSTPTSCHEHPLQDYVGVASGTFTGVEHEYPSYLTLRLTATDSGGLQHTTSRRLDPAAVTLSFQSQPSGLLIALGSESFTAPASRTVIVGSSNTVSAPSPQTINGRTYVFASWSDGGAQTHIVRPGPSPLTLVASFVEAASSLPSGWSTQDIGATGVAGSASSSGGTMTVRGAGADVWGTADAFHYTHRPLAGDGSIVARVASLAGSQAWVKVGVMIRGSTDPGAAQAFLLLSNGKGPRFQRRTSQGAITTSTGGFNAEAPAWLRLTRSGNTVTAAVSANGTAWTTVASDTLTLGPSALVGLAVSSHDPSQLATGVFDNITVTGSEPPTALPAGWQAQDVGAVGAPGAATEVGGLFTVKGAGADIWGTADAFHYAYRSLTGDGTIIARVASISGVQAWTKVGVMMRGSTAADAAQAMMLASTGKGMRFQWRTTPGGLSESAYGPSVGAPQWVRLVRTGNVITASTSSDGQSWVTVGSDSFTLPATILVGLAVSSHETSQTATGTFDNVTVTAGPPPPLVWQNADIGAVGPAGSVATSGGSFTIKGSGEDVWGTADAFHYVYREMTGDGSITARVASASGPHAWTKVGVMLRETLSPSSPHAFMLVSTGKGLAFQRRIATAGLSTHTAGPAATAPYWVRLTRSGTTVTASVSTNGTNWSVVGSESFTMGATIYVGLAVTSHSTSQLGTGVLDSVVIAQ